MRIPFRFLLAAAWDWRAGLQFGSLVAVEYSHAATATIS